MTTTQGRASGLTPVRAGAAYFGIVFALGFALGVARGLLVGDAESVARLLAVLIELPIMLAASWMLCGWVVRRFRVPATPADRLLMGGAAFLLLILAEALVGTLLLGRSMTEHVALYGEGSHALGLLAQLVFASMPLLRRRSEGKSSLSP